MVLNQSQQSGIFSSEDISLIIQAVRPAVIMHAPTRFVREPLAEKSVSSILALNPKARPTILWCDPNADQPEFLGYPAKQLKDADPVEHDLVVVASPVAVETFWHFLTRSDLAVPHVVAPCLPSGPHRIFLRKAILNAMCRPGAFRAMEIGCIESIEGGCRTSLALAENLRLGDAMTSLDSNPYSLDLSRFFCRGQRPDHTFICHDVFEVIWDELLPVAIDFVLEHIWGDCPENVDLLGQLFEGIEPRLAPSHSLLFLSVHTDEPRSGSFQQLLLDQGYVREGSLLETRTPRPRYLVWMRKEESTPNQEQNS